MGDEDIIARSTDQPLTPEELPSRPVGADRSALEQIVSVAAVEVIPARTAVETVASAASVKAVVAGEAAEDVRTGVADESVVSTRPVRHSSRQGGRREREH